MAKLTKKIISIDQLLINPNNPRFESVKNQQEAIETMLGKKGDEIKKLAKDIVTKGLNPSKSLMVIESKNNKFLTLEGNRRVVSLTLLNDPNKTKNLDFREFFHKLHDEHLKKIPMNIPCIIFQTEEEARPWIVLEHTGGNKGIGVVGWNTEQQRRYLNNFSRLLSIFEFADDNNISRNDVDSTNVERLISTPYVCEQIGISFSDGKMKSMKPKAKIKKNIEKVFTKMSQDKFKVGHIYTKELREKWIDNTIESEVESQKTKKTSTSTKPKTNKKSNDRKYLIPEDCNLLIAPKRINDIYLELKEDLILNGKKATPNAVGVLFRVFIEMSIHHYIQIKQIQLGQHSKLKEKVEKTAQYMLANKLATTPELKNIRKIAQASQTDVLNLDRFNDYVHSSFVHPESDGLKAKWQNLQIFFEILWGDLDKKSE